MATSSKVQFKLEVLKKKALEAIDFRIAQKQIELMSYEDEATIALRIKEWRARQESRVSELLRRLGGEDEIGDHELSNWALESIPRVDRWDRDRAERDLNHLESLRAKIVAKSESLVGDEQGNIALTKTQLDEVFGL